MPIIIPTGPGQSFFGFISAYWKAGDHGNSRALHRLRVRDYLWPEKIDGIAIRPLFPGIGADKLGKEIVALGERCIGGGATVMKNVLVPIELRKEAKGNNAPIIRGMLRGWWKEMDVGMDKQMAIYGKVYFD